MPRTLSEAESKRVLAAHGVPVVDERIVTTPDDAVRAAEDIGYPLVLKLCGERIVHKTERGLVRLGLADAAAVRHAAEDVLAAARPEDGAVELLVASMVHGTRELIAGLHTDPQFGKCVMVGVGGVTAEAVADVAFGLVPIRRVDAEDMLDDLRAQSFLGDFRGEPPVDRAGMCDVLLGLARLAESTPSVLAVDVNPLVIVDGKPVAVDALVEVEG
jgi:succinyl-CoA synthetase beta subunit